MKIRNSLLALSMLAVGITVSEPASGANYGSVKPAPGGGSESHAVGLIYCYVGGVTEIADAQGISPIGSGTLLYTDGGGTPIFSTCPSLANLGPDAATVPAGVMTLGRSAILCEAKEADVIYYGIASSATVLDGVVLWEEDKSGDNYVSTLACRVRLLN